MKLSRTIMASIAVGALGLGLAACGGGSGGSSSSMPAPSSSTSNGTPTSAPAEFCATFKPLLTLKDPTGPDDPSIEKALEILDAAKAAGGEQYAADIDSIEAVYTGVQDGSISIPVDTNDPVVQDAARAIQSIILDCGYESFG